MYWGENSYYQGGLYIKASLGMTSRKIISKPKPKHPYHHHIWDSPYFCKINMDIHIWPTYLKSFCPNFFLKNHGSEIPYLPTIWTYFQNFLVFFNPLLSAKLDAAVCCVVEVIRLKKEVEKGIRKKNEDLNILNKAMKAGKEENEKLCWELKNCLEQRERN